MEAEAQKMVSEISEKVAEKVLQPITESVMEKIMEKLPEPQNFQSSEEKQVEAEKKAAEAFSELGNGKVKALTTGGSTSGAEFIPTYIAEHIERVASSTGLVDKYARRWPMQGSKENIPTASSVSSYRVAEGAKITSSQPTTGAINLSSKTLGVIIPVSKKMLQNASPKLVAALGMLAGEAFAKLRDQWALLGLGSGEGVFQHASVPGVTMASTMTTYAKVTPEDLLDVIDKVDEDVSTDKLRWVHSRSVLNILRRLRAQIEDDKQDFLFSGFGQSTPPTIWDIPYSLSPIMPKKSDGSQADKKFMALVNFDKIIRGEDQPYTVSMSDQATITDVNGTDLINMFEQEMVALKYTVEEDIQLADPAKAFAWLKTAAS